MPHAIRIHATGGPEVMVWEEVDPGRPGDGEVRVRHSAVGLNFIDVYHRTGLYPLPELPAILGREAAGVVEEVGAGVTAVSEGDRVAYPLNPGTYCESRVVDAGSLVPLPDGISDRQAAAVMLKGMTAHYLLRRTYRVRPGDTILFHAAAGGVGLIACQWAKHLGATVIGTVGSDEKADLARAHGCDVPVVYTRESFVDRVRSETDGAGVPVVYDSVGRDTFDDSLDCLAPLGTMVSFGQASGPVPPVDPQVLSRKGSLFLTRPTLMTYIAKREDMLAAAAELFEVVESGAVKIEIGQTYPLRDAPRAHRDLEARRTRGSTVLLP
jgi:NADPH2:quinone reductase